MKKLFPYLLLVLLTSPLLADVKVLGSGGGTTSISSGVTVISGGADTQVCFNDSSTLSCGDSGLLFAETANTLTVLGNIELGHASANTLSASSGILSVEGVALLDASANQIISAGTKTFQGGTLTVNSTGAGTPAYLTIPALSALTGADNVIAGSGAAAALTTGNQNVIIGSNAGDGATTGITSSIIIGYNAGTGSNLGGTNVIIGATAMDGTNSTGAASNVSVGFDTLGACTSCANNTAIGTNAGNTITTGSGNIFLGLNSDGIAAGSSQLAVGRSATTTASNQAVFGGDAFQLTDIYWSEGTTNPTALAVTHNGTGGSGTDNAGGGFIVAGGKGTGTADGGPVVLQTSSVLTTGTTLQSLRTRKYFYAGTKTLTAATATDVVRVAIASRGFAGGIFSYCVRASDATDDLLRCGESEFAAVNKSGTETCTIATIGTDICSDTVTPGTCAVSTLTASLTCTSSTADTVDIEIAAAAAITETSLDVEWSLELNRGTGAITPQ